MIAAASTSAIGAFIRVDAKAAMSAVKKRDGTKPSPRTGEEDFDGYLNTKFVPPFDTVPAGRRRWRTRGVAIFQPG